MEIEGVVYETLVVSDCERDSLQFECYRCEGEARRLVFEVVRFDTQRKLFFIPHEAEIPFALLSGLLPIAKSSLGEFFDDSAD
jgi:hypothetical protein